MNKYEAIDELLATKREIHMELIEDRRQLFELECRVDKLMFWVITEGLAIVGLFAIILLVAI